MNCLRIAKSHFAFGRVHVDINACRIDLKKQYVSRVTVVMQHILISLAQCVREYLVAHEAAIDEKILRISARTARSGCARPAMYANCTGILLDFAVAPLRSPLASGATHGRAAPARAMQAWCGLDG